jgi:hypothetical protein
MAAAIWGGYKNIKTPLVSFSGANIILTLMTEFIILFDVWRQIWQKTARRVPVQT